MKIIGLKVENVRKLKAVEMSIGKKAGLVPIVGKNEQGKSTVLDAVEMLIKGRTKFTKDMITHGQDSAKIIGFFDNLTVERKIKDNYDTLEIRDLDGHKIDKTPQAFLNSFINELTFNPQPFLQKKTEDKIKFIMDLLHINFDNINNEIKNLYDERTLTGRLKNSIGEPKPVKKVNPVDVSEIEKHNSIQSERKNDIENANWKLKSIKEKIKEKELELKELKEREQKGIEYVNSLPKPEPIKDLTEANAQNQAHRDYLNYIEQDKKYKALESSYKETTNKIEKLRKQKLDTLQKAKLPVEKLSLKEDGLFYDGIHCENWSKSQAHRIALDLCLSMKPELKAIFIDDGENYDSDNLKELETWAKQNDIQVFIAIVKDIPEKLDENFFYIEDGTIKEVLNG